MASVFGKLQLKEQTEILVLGAPASFESELATLTGVRVIRDAAEVEKTEFLLAFVMTQEQVDAAADIVKAKTAGDAMIWIAYPKGTSKKFKCALNRDTGWEALGRAGLEAVRQVSIDEDWTALRFRRVEFIKTMSRRETFALTQEGKAKTTHPQD